ncbi:hypothetical protein BFJ63_vAg13961 [Fusarium oxysporum f. sp. narcissi]|uniref:Uncharacterized protein n=2 Tax=Fusarium TaxID=5506 RepID=A0A4Q2VD38_FUSOX|nr:hypothetical protein BFJ72_g14375 [Fusarium proliferatum]RYC83129.1 hypothetical protein BFJ63_vAg13961 [Fusarium oxysporum f. sp. narcissi]
MRDAPPTRPAPALFSKLGPSRQGWSPPPPHTGYAPGARRVQAGSGEAASSAVTRVQYAYQLGDDRASNPPAAGQRSSSAPVRVRCIGTPLVVGLATRFAHQNTTRLALPPSTSNTYLAATRDAVKCSGAAPTNANSTSSGPATSD